MSYWQQFRVMFLWNVKNQRANPASILNPLLFSLTFIILFKVAFSHLERTESLALFCAQSFLVVMVGSQVALLGTFDQEARDQLFELMQTSPLDYSAWYLAKYFGSLLLACFAGR